MKNNILKYIVIAALLVNAATLIFFWLKHQEAMPQRRPFEVLIEELQLDSAQQKNYKLLRESHHQAHDSLLRNMAEQRKILYSQKQNVNDTITHKIGLLQKEIELLTYQHFETVRDICTPNQQIKLTQTVQNIMKPKNKRRRPPPNKQD